MAKEITPKEIGVVDPKREPKEDTGYTTVGTGARELICSKSAVEVVPGPRGATKIGEDSEGKDIMETNAPNAIKRTFVEVPTDEKFELVLRNEDGAEQILFEGIAEVENLKKCVIMVKVRMRSDAGGVIKPLPEELPD